MKILSLSLITLVIFSVFNTLAFGLEESTNDSNNTLTDIIPLLNNIDNSLKQNNEDLQKNLHELKLIREQISDITFHNSDSDLLSNLSKEELNNMIQDKTNQINTTIWNSSKISDFTQYSLTFLGFALGLIGAYLIDVGKEIRSKNEITDLLKDDLLRIHKNIKTNLELCKKLSIDVGLQHEFLNEIKSIPDIINFQKLGAQQEFNFWNTILSSTMLIRLKKNQIKNIQTVYDLLKKYNMSIHSIMYEQNPESQITTLPAIPILMNLLLENRSMNHAHRLLSEVCQGLISIHESYQEILRAALLSLKVKESELK